MKTFSIIAVILSMAAFFVSSSQAASIKKIACRASGTVQSIKTLVIEPTDIEGQILATSSDQTGALSFFVSDGSLNDEKILVARRHFFMDGDYTIYLQQTAKQPGKAAYALDEFFVCDENNIEFCYGPGHKDVVKSKTDAQLNCKYIQ